MMTIYLRISKKIDSTINKAEIRFTITPSSKLRHIHYFVEQDWVTSLGGVDSRVARRRRIVGSVISHWRKRIKHRTKNQIRLNGGITKMK
jgi:hypothetical protein